MQHIYNKGKRTWTIAISVHEDGSPNETVVVGPGRSVALPDKIADKYTSRYPKDLIFGEGEKAKSSKQFKARMAELEKENEEMKARMAELEGKKDPSEKDALLKQAEEKGIEVDKRWGVEKLKEVIAEKTKEGE